MRYGPAEHLATRDAGPTSLGMTRIRAFYAPPLPRIKESYFYNALLHEPFEAALRRVRADPLRARDAMRDIARIHNKRASPWPLAAASAGLSATLVERMERRGAPFYVLQTTLLRAHLAQRLADAVQAVDALAAQALRRCMDMHLELLVAVRRTGFYSDGLVEMPGVAALLWPPPTPYENRGRGRALSLQIVRERTWAHVQRQSLLDIYMPRPERAPCGAQLPDMGAVMVKGLAERLPPALAHVQTLLHKVQHYKCAQRHIDSTVVKAARASPAGFQFVRRVVTCSLLGALEPAAVAPPLDRRVALYERWCFGHMSLETLQRLVAANDMRAFYAFVEYCALCMRLCMPWAPHLTRESLRAVRGAADAMRRTERPSLALDEICGGLLETHPDPGTQTRLHLKLARMSREDPQFLVSLRSSGRAGSSSIVIVPPPHPDVRLFLRFHRPGLQTRLKRTLRATQQRHMEMVGLYCRPPPPPGEATFDPGLRDVLSAWRDHQLRHYPPFPQGEAVALLRFEVLTQAEALLAGPPTKAARGPVYTLAAHWGVSLRSATARIEHVADLCGAVAGMFRGWPSLQVLASHVVHPEIAVGLALLLSVWCDPRVKIVELKRGVAHIATGRALPPKDRKVSVLRRVMSLQINRLPAAERALDFIFVAAVMQEQGRRMKLGVGVLSADVAHRQRVALQARFVTDRGPLPPRTQHDLALARCCLYCYNSQWRTEYVDLGGAAQIVTEPPGSDALRFCKGLRKTRAVTTKRCSWSPQMRMLHCCCKRQRVTVYAAGRSTLRELSQPVRGVEGSLIKVWSRLPKKLRVHPILYAFINRPDDAPWDEVRAALPPGTSHADMERLAAEYRTAVDNAGNQTAAALCNTLPILEIALPGRVVTLDGVSLTTCIDCGGTMRLTAATTDALGPRCGCWVKRAYTEAKSTPAVGRASNRRVAPVFSALRELRRAAPVMFPHSANALRWQAARRRAGRAVLPPRCRLCSCVGCTDNPLVELPVGQASHFFCVQHLCFMHPVLRDGAEPTEADFERAFASLQQRRIAQLAMRS